MRNIGGLSSKSTAVASWLIVLIVLVARAASGQIASGFPAFNSIQRGPFDEVNLANVNVHFKVPVFHRSGRGLAFAYDLTYDSTVFSASAQAGGFFYQSNFGWNPIGEAAIMGYVIVSSVECSSNISYTNYFNWAYIDRSGTEHPFPSTFFVSTNSSCGPTQATAASTDASGYTITVSTANGNPKLVSLYDSGGNSIAVPVSGWEVGGITGVSGSIADPNGNVISTDGAVFTDTLGTTALSTSSTGVPTLTSETYTYTGPNGASSLVVNYKVYPAVATQFLCQNRNDVFYEGFLNNGVPLVDNIVMPDGAKYTFSYEATPDPNHHFPAGSVTARIISIGLPSGGTVSYQYTGANDGINCLDGTTAGLTRTTPDGTWTYSHSASGTSGTTTVTDPKGNQTVVTTQGGFETERQLYQGAVSSNVLLETIITCYNGNPSPCTTAANTTSITLPITQTTVLTQLENSAQTGMVTSGQNTFINSNGLPTEIDEYDFASGSSPGSLLRKTTIAYDTALGNIVNRPSTITVYNGGNTQIAQTTYQYDTHGNQTSIARAVNTSTTIQSTATYNSNGTVQNSTDFNNNQTSYVYGSGSCNGSFPTTVNEPASLSRSLAWNCTGGVLTSLTDENSQTTSYGYTDPNYWRLTSVTYPDGGGTTYSYNSSTVPWNVTQSTKITGSQTLAIDTIYDNLGRISQQQTTSDPAGTDYVVSAYDGDGLLASVTNPYRSTSDPTYGVTQYSYDTLGRMTKQTQPDGNTIQSSYSSNCVTTTDEAGKLNETCNDGLGRIESAFEPDSNNGLNWETDYGYDALNDLVSVTQKGGSSNSSQWRTRSFTYDGLARLTQSVTPEAGTTTHAYTTSTGALCSGRPSQECRRTDARGTITTFTYDGQNRLTGKTYSDSTPAVGYSYDQTSFNGLTITNGKARRTGMTDGSGETAWSYDPMGRTLTRRQTIAGVTASIVHSYNLDGSVASITYPSGRTYAYSYDNAQNAASLADSAHNINFVTSTQYNAPGLMTSAIHGAVPGWNAITETNSYNNRLQPTQFEAASPVPLTLFNLTFSYNQGSGKNNGNVVQIANVRDSTRSVQYTYDQVSRLSNAQTYQATTWGDSYSYDAWGNLLGITVTQGTAQNLSVTVNGNNQVTSPAFRYDADGNVTWDTVNAMNYDAEGRMNPASGLSYTYDGNGRRVEKSDGTLYWMDDNLEPLSVGTTSGSIARDYVFFGGKRIAFVSLSSGNPYFYFSDQINSTAVIASGDGKTIQWDADYFPFGSQRKVYTNLLENHYLFTGDEWDYETGYSYSVARYEAGQWGRFLRPDPFDGSMDKSNPQSLNRYAYVTNNPTNVNDPFGMGGVPGATHVCALNDNGDNTSICVGAGADGTLNGGLGANLQAVDDPFNLDNPWANPDQPIGGIDPGKGNAFDDPLNPPSPTDPLLAAAQSFSNNAVPQVLGWLTIGPGQPVPGGDLTYNSITFEPAVNISTLSPSSSTTSVPLGFPLIVNRSLGTHKIPQLPQMKPKAPGTSTTTLTCDQVAALGLFLPGCGGQQ